MSMKNLIKHIYLVTLILFISSCGGGEESSGEDIGGENSSLSPTAASLLKPANNSECLDENNVSFSWSASENTDSYNVVIKNLDTNELQTFQAQSTSRQIGLSEGTPYSWYIVSKSNTSLETAKSDTWKFYLAGDGITNYVPFPAELVSPANGATVTGGAAVLRWNGSDADGDFLSYNVYVDQKDATTLVNENSTENLYTITNTSTGTYYWKIISKDSKGNKSESDLFYFKVN